MLAANEADKMAKRSPIESLTSFVSIVVFVSLFLADTMNTIEYSVVDGKYNVFYSRQSYADEWPSRRRRLVDSIPTASSSVANIALAASDCASLGCLPHRSWTYDGQHIPGEVPEAFEVH